jgi:hypothetical protein
MSRDDGFEIMDVSTSICFDMKFRLIQRQAPELVAAAFTAYISVMAESWKAGRRVPIALAWPAFLPPNAAVEAVMRTVGLLDKKGLVAIKAWHGWFEPARERRAAARARWKKYNEKRTGSNENDDAAATSLPRGSRVGTATSVPSVRPSVPSEGSSRAAAQARPVVAQRGEPSRRAEGWNPRANGTSHRGADRAKSWRKQQRELAYYRGQITEEQLAEMNGRDAPLSELPDPPKAPAWLARVEASA